MGTKLGKYLRSAAPANADPGYNVTTLLEEKQYSELDMVRGAEKFFTSLGFAPLPLNLYERLFEARDRDVVCHASAWDIDAKDDIRIKMCIKKMGKTSQLFTMNWIITNAYKDLSVIYQDSANDGFHEAIGDTIALSHRVLKKSVF